MTRHTWIALTLVIFGACGGDPDLNDLDATVSKPDATVSETDVAVPLDTTSPPDVVDAGEDVRPIDPPESVPGEQIYRAPFRVATPPTWNSHIPKLVADDTYLYAISHFSPPGPTRDRQTVILRRSKSGGDWTTVATMEGLHQPPAAAFDSEQRLHLAFDCLHNDGAVQTCFQGGVSSRGLASRAYHLVFSAREGDGGLRFDTYANRNEWTLHSDGYHGIGSSPSGRTVWSFLSEEGARIIQTTTVTTTGTYPRVDRAGTLFLYPIHLPLDGGSVLSFAGDFDPAGGTNGGYPSTSLMLTNNLGTETLVTLRPNPPVDSGATGAFPSDLDMEADGTVIALAHRKDEVVGTCSEVLRFDAGIREPPTVLLVGCVAPYAKLQIASDGQFFILTGGGGHAFRLGQSRDRGASWEWFTFSVDVPGAVEDRYFAPTPIESRTSVTAFEADLIRFVFSGATKDGSDSLYYTELSLAPWL